MVSGETEDSVSGWTTDTLHAHIEGLIPLLRDINSAELATRDQRVSSELAIRDERMRAMDKANIVLDRTIHQMPTDLQVAIVNLEALTTMRMNGIEQMTAIQFQLIAKQFVEFNERLIRDLAANGLQVAAAFAASEKLSIALDRANKEAIYKSEASTAANAAAQGATIADVKDRLTRLESERSGGHNERDEARQAQQERRQGMASLYGLLGAFVGVIGIVLAVIAFTRGV